MKITNSQIAWVGANVIGHSIDPMTNKIDTTEGFGGFDSVFCTSFALSGRAVDIGGGSSDANIAYIAYRYLMDCSVYDPFKRPALHNEKVLRNVISNPCNVVFSISVLNVISIESARKGHIELCLKALKSGGKAIFKAWPGDNSGIGKQTPSGFQSNRGIETYMEEIASVFGREMVHFDPEQKAMICFNNRDVYPRGSVCIN